jgi:hypothetical protein
MVSSRRNLNPTVQRAHPLTDPWCEPDGMSVGQTSSNVRVMSVIPLKADIHQRGLHVRLVPKTDSGSWFQAAAGLRRF